jgi:hypothetical protein
MAPVEQTVLSEGDYDSRHIAGRRTGPAEIEFSISNALLQ